MKEYTEKEICDYIISNDYYSNHYNDNGGISFNSIASLLKARNKKIFAQYYLPIGITEISWNCWPILPTILNKKSSENLLFFLVRNSAVCRLYAISFYEISFFSHKKVKVIRDAPKGIVYNYDLLNSSLDCPTNQIEYIKNEAQVVAQKVYRIHFYHDKTGHSFMYSNFDIKKHAESFSSFEEILSKYEEEITNVVTFSYNDQITKMKKDTVKSFFQKEFIKFKQKINNINK